MCLAGASYAQGWLFECIDPENDTPYSTGYGTIEVSNSLMRAVLGVSGTVTYGPNVCYGAARTLDASGRLGFQIGGVGSVQSNFDDFLALTVGMPADPVGDYVFARILKDSNEPDGSALFGDQGLSVAFVGASNRYLRAIWSDADVQVEYEMRLIADAVRMRWRMTNLAAENQALGLLFCCYAGMRTGQGQTDSQTGANQANSLLGGLTSIPKQTPEGYIGFTVLETTRPVRNERRYASTNPKFPKYVDFLFGQTEAYGMRVENVPAPAFTDATSADLIVIGNQRGPVEGLIANNNVRLHVAGDPTGVAEEADILLNETSFVQRFPIQGVQPGQFRDIVHYIRSPWSVGDYNDPYAIIADAPRLIAADDFGQDGLSPNPFTIRAYIDNQYARIDKEVALSNVSLTINLPAGLSLAPGEVGTKNIGSIAPNAIANTQWQVQSDGETFGKLQYTITVSPTPGPVKTITGEINIASTPRMSIGDGANLLTFPYNFNDTSFNAILGMQAGIDYVAYRWDPETLSYAPVSSPERGVGYWILANGNKGVVDLNGADSTVDDAGTGGLLTTIRRGWNLIGNPYNYGIRLSDLIAVVDDNPSNTFTWTELVSNGFVSSALAYFERNPALPGGGSYKFTTSINSIIEPHKGYWIYVATFNPIRLSWPPVFTPGLPNSGRSLDEDVWPQNDKQWRLQLSARNNVGQDSSNYIGFVADARKASQLQLPEPPPLPNGSAVTMSIAGQMGGEPTRMAQAIDSRSGKSEWSVRVDATEPGDVTVTWPNLASLPRNLRFRLTDPATGETRDMRAVSGYTLTMPQAGSRELTISVEPGGSVRPVIGNVIVTRPGRDNNAPVTISYALSADALVTVRVLSGSGKEVFTVTRGRSDSAGENNVTWQLRDSANRAVAPGTYNIEILAETPTGDRVRKIVPVTVIR